MSNNENIVRYKLTNILDEKSNSKARADSTSNERSTRYHDGYGLKLLYLALNGSSISTKITHFP